LKIIIIPKKKFETLKEHLLSFTVEIHEHLAMTGQLEDINLNVPEAIEAVNNRFPFITEWTDVSINVLIFNA
jgi:hypothetical protein